MEATRWICKTSSAEILHLWSGKFSGIKSALRRSSPWWSFWYEYLLKLHLEKGLSPNALQQLPIAYLYHQEIPSTGGSRHLPWTTSARQPKHDNPFHPNRHLFSITTLSRWDSPSCIPNNSNRIFVMSPVFLFFVHPTHCFGWSVVGLAGMIFVPHQRPQPIHKKGTLPLAVAVFFKPPVANCVA